MTSPPKTPMDSKERFEALFKAWWVRGPAGGVPFGVTKTEARELFRSIAEPIAQAAERDALERAAKDYEGAIKLLRRWVKQAMRGAWRDKTHLSLSAHPIYDDTYGYLQSIGRGLSDG